MKGNEKDCICEKPKGKHRKHCQAYRLAEFLKKSAGMEEAIASAELAEHHHKYKALEDHSCGNNDGECVCQCFDEGYKTAIDEIIKAPRADCHNVAVKTRAELNK